MYEDEFTERSVPGLHVRLPLSHELASTRAVRKVSRHFEYLENRSRGLDVTWQPVRGDLTVHP